MGIKIGVIGLGKMGASIVYRLIKGNYSVIGYDPDETARQNAQKMGALISDSFREIAQKASAIWMLVPAGDIIDSILNTMLNHLSAQSIIIDGGNSKFTDSIRRAQLAEKNNFFYLDCGTSGGIAGRENGFCLMIGGEKKAFLQVEEVFRAIAAPQGYAYMGPAGSGHYVKMIHNGIEYALLQAYAEGFHLLKQGKYKDLDLASIARVWSHGSIIRSYLLELCAKVFEKKQSFEEISGELQEGGTGLWTVQEAHTQNIPVHVIEESLKIRGWSRKTGGNYATKLIALLRQKFGGHAVKKIQDDT